MHQRAFNRSPPRLVRAFSFHRIEGNGQNTDGIEGVRKRRFHVDSTKNEGRF